MDRCDFLKRELEGSDIPWTRYFWDTEDKLVFMYTVLGERMFKPASPKRETKRSRSPVSFDVATGTKKTENDYEKLRYASVKTPEATTMQRIADQAMYDPTLAHVQAFCPKCFFDNQGPVFAADIYRKMAWLHPQNEAADVFAEKLSRSIVYTLAQLHEAYTKTTAMSNMCMMPEKMTRKRIHDDLLPSVLLFCKNEGCKILWRWDRVSVSADTDMPGLKNLLSKSTAPPTPRCTWH